jgi:ankyrin repeat protein
VFAWQYGDTALMMAARVGHIEAVLVLLEARPEVEKRVPAASFMPLTRLINSRRI